MASGTMALGICSIGADTYQTGGLIEQLFFYLFGKPYEYKSGALGFNILSLKNCYRFIIVLQFEEKKVKEPGVYFIIDFF